jgi:hypothetical protein
LIVRSNVGSADSRAVGNEPIERTVITAAAAPSWISWTDLESGTRTARTLFASITRAGIW